MTIFVNAALVFPDSIREDWFLLEHNGAILSFGPMGMLPAGLDAQIKDCAGLYLAPGFVDLHCHGGGGHDFMDGTPEAVRGAAKAHLAHGTTTLLPTTLTSTDEDLFRAIDNFLEARKDDSLPHLPGLHLEGPYFSMEQRGAQNPAYLRSPARPHYEGILERAQGLVARWSAAPELEGALEMGDLLSRQGVVMSIGHSDADYDQVAAAVQHGYTHVTHFYSGMSTIVRRDGYRVLGVVEAAYLLDGLTVELIADGHHLPPELLRLILACKAGGSICLVTDSMRAAGLPDGPSILGSLREGQDVIVEDGVAKMPDRSCFAGSVATTDRLVRVMVRKAGLPLHQAVAMMTLHPAVFMGYDGKIGSLAIGKDADLVLLDEDIAVRQVYVSGQPISQ